MKFCIVGAITLLAGCADQYNIEPGKPYVTRVAAAMNQAEKDLSGCVVETGSRAKYHNLSSHLILISVSNRPPGLNDNAIPTQDELALMVEWRSNVQRCYARLLSQSSQSFRFATPILKSVIDRINNAYNQITINVTSWEVINTHLADAREGNRQQIEAMEYASEKFSEAAHQQELTWRAAHPPTPIPFGGVPFSVTIAGHKNPEFEDYMNRALGNFELKFTPSNGDSNSNILTMTKARQRQQ